MVQGRYKIGNEGMERKWFDPEDSSLRLMKS